MRSLFVTLLFISIISFKAKSQNETLSMENWETHPKIHSTENAFLKAPAWIILDKRKIQFTGTSDFPDQEYYSLHKLIHINNDLGKSLFKEISIQMNQNSEIRNIKARIIFPDGRTQNLPMEKGINEKKNDQNYKIFPLEGLEKGCEIEYEYVLKMDPYFFGREIIQGPVPSKFLSLEIMSPGAFIFVQRPYNFQITPQDTLLNNERLVRIQINDIPEFIPENFASNAINPYRIEYKLGSKINGSGQTVRLFTYKDLAKKIFAHFSVPSPNEKVKTLIQSNGWDKLPNDSTKILAVENFIKQNLKMDIGIQDSILNTPSKLLENKSAGADGIIRLFGSVFQELGLDFQFVTVGDRNGYPLDPDFSNWKNAENYLIFFPSTSKYLAPTEFAYRYPWIPSSWGSTSGLFCNNSQKGGIENLLAEIGTIDLENAHKSFTRIDMKMEFNKSLDTLLIDNKFLYGGYAACRLRGLLNPINKESRLNFVKSITKKVRNNEIILFSEVLNPEFEKESANIPLIVHTRSKEPVKKVEGRIAIKLSSILPPTQEINSESNRKLPIEQEFGNIIGSKIQIKIPNGYSFKDLINLSKDQNFRENDENTLGVSSGYELKGDILTIHTQEFYTHTTYPSDHLSIFTGIKKTASDLRKLILVLQKN